MSREEFESRRWEMEDPKPVSLPRMPPKTTFGGAGDRDRMRIDAFMDEIDPVLRPWLDEPGREVGISLCVGLAPGTDRLVQHDLDNFLEPLVSRLGHRRVAFARATKAHGNVSTVAIGAVIATTTPFDSSWHHARLHARSLSPRGQRALGLDLSAQAAPMPWGPIELELALRQGPRRSLVNAWKAIIDSFVPILGRAPGKAEFDIEDGRIVALSLHREIDPGLGDAVEVALWWRAEAGAATVGGPRLAYDVGRPEPAGAASPRAEPVKAPSSRTGPHRAAPGHEVVTTTERFRALKNAGSGLVVKTDDSDPPILHIWRCSNVQEQHFHTKVIAGGMKNGQYVSVPTRESAQETWARLRVHACA